MRRIQRIRDNALVSVGRASLFGVLAVWVVVFGLITWPVLAMRAGAICFALMTAILILKAWQAGRRDFKRSETWILLERRHDLPDDVAARVIPSILAEAFWRFATYAAILSLGFWVAAVVVWLIRGMPTGS
ncbi:MAG: hypothetical protein FJX47_16510 [Alphaproteobacteria bacterium]|nr:hypothetical protein [Alphaproteobacteria bacterium]